MPPIDPAVTYIHLLGKSTWLVSPLRIVTLAQVGTFPRA